MNINSNTVVSLTYELHTTTPEGQQVFVEKANEEQPLVFLYGVGMMLPKFEEHLAGLKAGDDYSFELSAADGYGEVGVLDKFGNLKVLATTTFKIAA